MRSRLHDALIISAALALLSPLACSDAPINNDGKIAADGSADVTTRSDGTASDKGEPDQRLAEDAATEGRLDAPSADGKISRDVWALADLPTGCDAGKISFTQKNPAKYELWELCFPAGDSATEAAIKRIDATANCSHRSGGIAAKCPAGFWRCMGALERDPTSKEVKPAAWTRLCQLSSLPKVTKIDGGHYI